MTIVSFNTEASERDKYIKKSTDGNERIIAAEIQTKNKPICLINVYLPTKMANYLVS
jgi:exonuclease III